MTSIEKIKEDFEAYGITNDEDDVLNKCFELCNQYDITGEQIAVCWMNGGFSELTVDSLEVLERKEFSKSAKSKKRKANEEYASPYKPSPRAQLLSDGDADILAAYGASPAATKIKDNDQSTPIRSRAKRGLSGVESFLQHSPIAPSLSQSPGTPSLKFASRTNQGNVVAAFGTEKTSRSWTADLDLEVKVTDVACGGDNHLSAPYRFMFEKLRDSGDLLDEEISYIGDQMMDKLNITEQSRLRDISNLSQWFFGRICCDSIGRLNAASVLLEGNRDVNDGDCVAVNLSDLPSYALFPGQIVGVKGVNATGDKINAEQIVTGRLLPTPTSTLTIGNSTLQIMLAAGPFTTTENLLYEPLDDLLKIIVRDPPNILIMLGPILDSNHPTLSDPQLVDCFDDIVDRCLLKISSTLENCGVQGVVVSNQRDVSCPPIYPTPPMNQAAETSKALKIVSDPCLLGIGGLTVALTSTDSLMQISKEEISFPSLSSEKMHRLSEHLLMQQSFCPVYPPPEGFSICMDQADIHCRLPFTPHVMVIPSDFMGFTKDVHGCCVINPERLSKGKGGGCFARLEVTDRSPENKPPGIVAQVIKV